MNVPYLKQFTFVAILLLVMALGTQWSSALPVLQPIADATVVLGSETSHNSTVLGISGQYGPNEGCVATHMAYLKFDLSSANTPITEASLRLSSTFASASGTLQMGLYGANDDTWDETAVTWNTRPPLTTLPLSTASLTAVGNTLLFANTPQLVAFLETERQNDPARLASLAIAPLNCTGFSITQAVSSREGATAPVLELALLTPTPTSTPAAVDIHINFQPATAPIPAGYLVDSGLVYGDRGNGYSYGWNASNSANVYDRNRANSPDQRYDTVIFTQAASNPNAVWEIALPNGYYQVHLVSGDARATDSVYKVAAEGVLLVNGTPTAAARWVEGTAVIEVSDGFLTLTNAAGAVNNKLNFIDIISSTPVPTPTPIPTVVPGQDTIYVASSSGGSVSDITFTNEDILSYHTGSGIWSFYFDGSDLALGATAVDAFDILGDGSLLLSLSSDLTISPLGLVDDSDVLRFIPTSLGNTTAGTLEWYFDGSDVGLETADEDVDAVALTEDGRLLISTLGAFAVTGAAGQDEDLLRFTPTNLGSNTNGLWELHFDGSDVGLTLASEDIAGVWPDPVTGQIYLTTTGTFNVTGVSGDGEDIFICTPLSLGDTTACTFTAYWDGGAVGFAGEIVNAFTIVRP